MTLDHTRPLFIRLLLLAFLVLVPPVGLLSYGALAEFAQGLTTLALEIEAGGVKKHHAERREQVATAAEQLLLDQVLGGSRSMSVVTLVAQFLAQPCHCSVKMVE